jgi:phosphomannomutase/phosphoglucomutase
MCVFEDRPMPMLPRADLTPNSYDHQTQALVKATGFREYDARWVLDEGINLLGVQALGLALGTYIHEAGVHAWWSGTTTEATR